MPSNLRNSRKRLKFDRFTESTNAKPRQHLPRNPGNRGCRLSLPPASQCPRKLPTFYIQLLLSLVLFAYQGSFTIIRELVIRSCHLVSIFRLETFFITRFHPSGVSSPCVPIDSSVFDIPFTFDPMLLGIK